MKRVYKCEECSRRQSAVARIPPCILDIGDVDRLSAAPDMCPFGGVVSDWQFVDTELPAAPPIGETVKIDAGDKPVTVELSKAKLLIDERFARYREEYQAEISRQLHTFLREYGLIKGE